jgi:hypothetical protein
VGEARARRSSTLLNWGPPTKGDMSPMCVLRPATVPPVVVGRGEAGAGETRVVGRCAARRPRLPLPFPSFRGCGRGCWPVDANINGAITTGIPRSCHGVRLPTCCCWAAGAGERAGRAEERARPFIRPPRPRRRRLVTTGQIGWISSPWRMRLRSLRPLQSDSPPLSLDGGSNQALLPGRAAWSNGALTSFNVSLPRPMRVLFGLSIYHSSAKAANCRFFFERVYSQIFGERFRVCSFAKLKGASLARFWSCFVPFNKLLGRVVSFILVYHPSQNKCNSKIRNLSKKM